MDLGEKWTRSLDIIGFPSAKMGPNVVRSCLPPSACGSKSSKVWTRHSMALIIPFEGWWESKLKQRSVSHFVMDFKWDYSPLWLEYFGKTTRWIPGLLRVPLGGHGKECSLGSLGKQCQFSLGLQIAISAPLKELRNVMRCHEVARFQQLTNKGCKALLLTVASKHPVSCATDLGTETSRTKQRHVNGPN